MNLETYIIRLTHNAAAIANLVQGVPAEQERWRPSASDWSILEVVNHLYDEEREDFRQRLDLLLHQPQADWPLIDPAGWVTSRQYSQRELPASLENFLQEREKSLEWLRDLSQPDWESGRMAPWGSKMRAGDMLAAWLAHDFLHIRQLNELQYAYWARAADPYQVGYAGDW
ncbi:MAG: DinB family protein [Anaerolineales bacterium]|nr:DinB family protein [Anaerolineales bacterium]